eukprot:29797-Pelagococcus_subviridis.AAC.18
MISSLRVVGGAAAVVVGRRRRRRGRDDGGRDDDGPRERAPAADRAVAAVHPRASDPGRGASRG